MSCDKTLVCSLFLSSIHPFLTSIANRIWNFSLDKNIFIYLSCTIHNFNFFFNFFQRINFIIARWWHTFDAFVHNTEILLDINQSNVARVTNRPNKNVQLAAIIFAEYRVCMKSSESDKFADRSHRISKRSFFDRFN